MIWYNALHICFNTFVKIIKLTLCTQRRRRNIITIPVNILSNVQNLALKQFMWYVDIYQ